MEKKARFKLIIVLSLIPFIYSCFLFKSSNADAYEELMKMKDEDNSEGKIEEITKESLSVNGEKSYKAPLFNFIMDGDEEIQKIEADEEKYKAVETGLRAGSKMSLAQLKSAINKGQYKSVAFAKIENSHSSKFYKGIGMFSYSKYNGLSKNEKLKWAREARNNFHEVGVSAHEENLKVKSILWEGITLYRYLLHKNNVNEVLKPLQWIQSNYSKTSYLNDSYLYSALVYAKAKNWKECQAMLEELDKTSSTDRVYDDDYKKWVGPQTAAAYYQRILPISGSSGSKSSGSNNKDEVAEKVQKIEGEVSDDNSNSSSKNKNNTKEESLDDEADSKSNNKNTKNDSTDLDELDSGSTSKDEKKSKDNDNLELNENVEGTKPNEKAKEELDELEL